jgi:serralysin
LLAALLSTLAAALSREAFAATYAVSPLGDDQASGGSAAPWRTLHRAAGALRAGDVLVLKAGRYNEPLELSQSGRSDAPISVIGEGRPVVEAVGDAVSIKASYVILKGLEAHSTGWGSAFVIGPDAHHVRVAQNIARDSACAGIAAVSADYVAIEDNEVFGNSRKAPWQCSGISLYQNRAVDQRPGFHNVISGNRIYDNMNVFVDDAVSHSGGRTTDGNGVIVDDFDHTQGAGPVYSGATLIENNVISDNGGRGVHVFHSRNVAIVHNVVFHDLKDRNLQRPAGEISAAFASGVVVFDNIAAPRPGELALYDGYSEGRDDWDYDLAVGQTLAVRSEATFGPHTLSGPIPQFVRAALGAGADFHLQSSSPALRQGAALTLGGSALAALRPGVPAPLGLSGR